MSSQPLAGSDAASPTWTEQSVLESRTWTDGVVSLRTTRDDAFAFLPGQYVRLGVRKADGGLVWRPFSMVSSPADAGLEFLARLVPGGEFSEPLARLRPGDPLLVEQRVLGFLTVDRLAAGKSLWMVASGTGLGPFVSILRDAQAAAGFEDLVIVHSVRQAGELAYRDEIEARGASGAPGPRVRYVPVVTREDVPGALRERIPRLIESGALQSAAGVALNPDDARVMACGNPDMCAELRPLLTARDFRTTRRGVLGNLAFENYW